MFDIISRFFWVLAIAVTFANVAFFKRRSVRQIKVNPDLSEGYAKLLRGYVFWLNIPWVVMGIGCTIGGVPTVWHYFRPSDGNIYVLAWFGAVFLLWILGTYWLLFQGGAEMLVKHPGAFRTDINSPTIIKLLWLACLAGGVVGVIFMWTMNIPVPPFR